MARITSYEVKKIIETNLDDSAIDVYILAANDFVTNTLSGQGLSTTTLKEIERWLTAHLMAVSRERQTVKEEIGQAKAWYADIFGEGLKSTTYGQTALTLDTTGILQKSGKRKANITAVTSFDT